jgi:nonribosomal peptide synthetase CepB
VEFDIGGTTRRVFRTGDRVKVLGDGNVMFAGRLDSELKIRGVRIDPREIEAILLGQPGVREAVAVVVESSESKTLRVGVTLDPDLPLFDQAALMRALEARLPPQSVPASISPIEQVPRSPSGKVDRDRAAEAILANRRQP